MAASSAAPQIFRGGLGVTSTRVGGAPTVGAPTPPHPITNGVRGVGIGHGLVGGYLGMFMGCALMQLFTFDNYRYLDRD